MTPHKWTFSKCIDGTRVRPGVKPEPTWVVFWQCSECQAECTVLRKKSGTNKRTPPGQYFVRRRKIALDCPTQLAQSIHQS